MMTNRNELKAAIIRKGMNMGLLAKKIGITVGSLSNKTNGHKEFRASEIERIADVLDLNYEDIGNIFFAKRVD
jgi:DNA-binding Xre family transcriptional regulator